MNASILKIKNGYHIKKSSKWKALQINKMLVQFTFAFNRN